jgi:anhydro-N-acetylmuramic acid kinase
VKSLFIGVMSGTSLDAADAALVDFSASSPRTLAFASVPFPLRLKQQVLDLCQPGRDSMELAGLVCLELAQLYARVVEGAIARAGAERRDIAAIGCHGQTVRHRPDLGFTVQLNDPARLAELTGIDVVADFRRRDMAAGGQGAPLVPAFHEAVFRRADRSRAIVNVGGIGNVTCLPANGPTLGFDCGPGNVLLDGWASRHLGTEFDEDGRWAASGRTDAALLEQLMREPFLALPPPKSTGRELFGLEWLEKRLPPDHDPANVQSTLTDFTARCIVEAIERFCPLTQDIYLAGGGARNATLVERITRMAAPRKVAVTDALGVPGSHVECMAFAWLALKCVRREAVDLTAVTGARHPSILGAIYPA